MAEYEARFTDGSLTRVEAETVFSADEAVSDLMDEWARSAGWGSHREALAANSEWPDLVRIRAVGIASDERIVVTLEPCECHNMMPYEMCDACTDQRNPLRWDELKRQYGIGPEYEGLHLVRY